MLPWFGFTPGCLFNIQKRVCFLFFSEDAVSIKSSGTRPSMPRPSIRIQPFWPRPQRAVPCRAKPSPYLNPVPNQVHILTQAKPNQGHILAQPKPRPYLSPSQAPRIHQNPSQIHHKSIKIHQKSNTNPSQIHQNSSKSIKIHQKSITNSSKSIKIHQRGGGVIYTYIHIYI